MVTIAAYSDHTNQSIPLGEDKGVGLGGEVGVEKGWKEWEPKYLHDWCGKVAEELK